MYCIDYSRAAAMTSGIQARMCRTLFDANVTRVVRQLLENLADNADRGVLTHKVGLLG